MTQEYLLNMKNGVRTNFKMQFEALKKIFFQIEKKNWVKTHQMTQDDLLNMKKRFRTDFKMEFEAAKKPFFKLKNRIG